MPIRVGIIGLSAASGAWATKTHVEALKNRFADEYTLVALCTSSPESAAAAAKAHGVVPEKAYWDAEALARDPDVDLVVVSVKVPMHKTLALPSLRAGKDMFVEWPLGNGLAEAKEMAALAKEKGIRTMVGLQGHNMPVALKAKEMITSGTLGNIISTSLVASSPQFMTVSARNAYLNDIENGANVITIVSAHLLDTFCSVLGEFKHLNASTATNFPTVAVLNDDGSTHSAKRTSKDWLAIHGVLEGGATAIFTYAATEATTPESFKWVISGDKGALKLESDSSFIQFAPTSLSQCLSGKDAKWEDVVTDPPMAFGGIGELYEAFAKGDHDRFLDFDGAVIRHEMLEAILRSADTGSRQSYRGAAPL